MIFVHFQGKPFNITAIQVYAPSTNAEEAEVEWFYEDLQDLSELTPKKRCPFHYRRLECKSRKSRNAWLLLLLAASVMSNSVRPKGWQPTRLPHPGILQARILEWLAISFPSALKWSESEVAQLCPTPSGPMDCSLPGSSIHGILQARVLEWGAIAFSRNT